MPLMALLLQLMRLVATIVMTKFTAVGVRINERKDQPTGLKVQYIYDNLWARESSPKKE